MARLVVPGPLQTAISGLSSVTASQAKKFLDDVGLDYKGEAKRRWDRDKDTTRPSDDSEYTLEENEDGLASEGITGGMVSRKADFSNKPGGDKFDYLLDNVPFYENPDTQMESKFKYSTKELVINPHKIKEADIFSATFGGLRDGFEFLGWVTRQDIEWYNHKFGPFYRTGKVKLLYPLNNPSWRVRSFSELCNHIATSKPIVSLYFNYTKHTPKGTW